MFTTGYLIANAYADDYSITVSCDKEAGQVNKKVFGNNFIGYDEAPLHEKWPWPPAYEIMDYGAGVWDPYHKESVKEVIDLAKEAGLSIIRFPGGCGVHFYDWKKTIVKNREHYLYGLDEFMKTVKEIGAEAVITVSDFIGNEKDAADLVEYLNAPCDTKYPWAEKRAENGHPEPYGVKYFEIGNEVSHGNHRDIKRVTPEEYSKKYIVYWEAMKKIDSSIKIGAVVENDWWWNRSVIEHVKDNVDFVIQHTSPPLDGDLYKNMNDKKLFKIVLGHPVLYDERYFQYMQKLIYEKTGRTDIFVAITEYNIGFTQDEPVPYRHSLGGALMNAELLRIFMNPEHKIIMANYWHFSNSYWGMVKSKKDSDKDYMKHDYSKPIGYIKRPNYYIYELYNKHFGDILINADTQVASYDLNEFKSYVNRVVTSIIDGSVVDKNLLDMKWTINPLIGVNVEEKDNILGIDFINPREFNYGHSLKHAYVQPDTYYKLSGYIKTESLDDWQGVCLEIGDGRGWDKTHSAMATNKFKGTNDWQYVEVLYRTLSDAESVDIMARRAGGEGTVSGKAFFRDVKLEKYVPAADTRIPYLSVNASKNKDNTKIYLAVINKNMEKAISTHVETKNCLAYENGEAYILNGPSVSATNEINNSNVRINNKEFKVNNNNFNFTFEPHSFTVIEIK
jgi:alpha-N-arabinofuranosidase